MKKTSSNNISGLIFQHIFCVNYIGPTRRILWKALPSSA